MERLKSLRGIELWELLLKAYLMNEKGGPMRFCGQKEERESEL